DLLAVLAVPGLDRDVPDDASPLGLDQVHGADVAAGLADRGGNAPEHARTVLDLEPEGEAIAGARGDGHHVTSEPPQRHGGPNGGHGGTMTGSTRVVLTGAVTEVGMLPGSRQGAGLDEG